MNKGFSLIELIVSIAIFVVMTTLLVGKFGNFSQDSNLTNAIYDIALTIRSSQTFGLNVKSSGPNATVTNDFSHAFGTHFETGSPKNTQFQLFADILQDDGLRTDGSEDVTVSSIKKGIVISDIKVTCGSNVDVSVPVVDITFRRPDPDAIIKSQAILEPGNSGIPVPCQVVQITIRAVNGATRSLTVRSTGQIAVN